MALAQPIHTIKLTYWPTYMTASTSLGGGYASWDTGFWGLDYRLDSQSRWGAHLQWVSGSQSNGGGAWASLTSGTDTIWSADVSHRWQTANVIVRGFLGYGSYNWESNFSGGPYLYPSNQRFTSSGFRIGGDGTVLLKGNWSLNGSVAWSPSNLTSLKITSLGTSSATTSASAVEWSVSLQYTSPSKWSVEGGYRGAHVGTGALPATSCSNPCTFQWAGFFITLGRTFP